MPTTSSTATALKLSMVAASLYTKPSISVHTWARTPTRTRIHTGTCTFTTTTTSPSPSSLPPPPHSTSLSPLSLSLPLNRNPEWRRLPPCAPLAYLSNHRHYNYSNHDNNLTSISNYNHNCNKYFLKKNTFLGFPFPNFPLSSSASSSSLSPRIFCSSTRSGSDPSGSDILAGMGSENKVVDDTTWYQNDRLKTAQVQPPSQSPPSSPDHHHHHHNKLLTLPTLLTLGRVAAVPLLVATFYVDSWWGRTATTSIFIVAAITDWLDGYLARKMRLGSAFGAFLDPVADKLMVAATLILLCSRPLEVGMFGQVPWLLTAPTIAIIGREITMSAVREWAASQSTKLLEAVAVNNLGKWKTATQMTALTILLATRDSSLGGPGILVASGVVFLYISAGLSVWSLAVYVSKIWKVLLK